MADKTGISWTDHTFNPWWGCTKIAPGCDHCYAAAFDHRVGGQYFEIHQAPRLTSTQNWQKVMRWHRAAVKDNIKHKVFCGSMMDWCDKDAPEGARTELFKLIKATPMLEWQLLTKRATLIERYLPPDWGDGYENVWLGTTVEDREYGLPRIDALRTIPAKVRFLSVEPLLEDLGTVNLDNIHWAIIGGESGNGFRPCDESWIRHFIAECDLADVAVWFKQHGGRGRDKGGCLIDGHEIKHWPKQANIQQSIED